MAEITGHAPRVIISTARNEVAALRSAFEHCDDKTLEMLAFQFGDSDYSKDQKLSFYTKDERAIWAAVGKEIWDRLDDSLIRTVADRMILGRERKKLRQEAVFLMGTSVVLGFLLGLSLTLIA